MTIAVTTLNGVPRALEVRLYTTAGWPSTVVSAGSATAAVRLGPETFL